MDSISTFTIADICEGQSFSFEEVITETMIDDFATITGDNNPLHMDRNFAIQRGFKDRVVHGAFLNGLVSRFVGVHLPGKNCLLLGMSMKYPVPTYPHRLLRVTGTVEQISVSAKAMIVQVVIYSITEQIIVAKGKVTVGFTNEG